MTIQLPASSPTQVAAVKLREQVLESLAAGELNEGDRVISGRKLAGQLGVSYVTARRAIKILVGEGLLETRPRQGVFVCEGTKQRLAPGPTTGRVRGLFYLGTLNGGYERTAAALGRKLNEAGYELVWSTIDELTEPALAGNLANWDEDAHVILGPVQKATVDRLAGLGRPLVLVDHFEADDRADCVSLDNEGAAFDAARRFLDAGHERVAYVGGLIEKEHPYYDSVRGTEWPNSILRAMGVRRAYVTRGMPLDETLFISVEHYKGARELGKRWFAAQSDTRPTAAVCFGASIAAGLLLEAKERGVKIPDEFAAAGMGTPQEGWAFGPEAMSHYAIDWDALGSEAGSLCLDRLREPERPRKRVVMPLNCVVGTTG